MKAVKAKLTLTLKAKNGIHETTVAETDNPELWLHTLAAIHALDTAEDLKAANAPDEQQKEEQR